ncbi:MAG: hypothetical protein ACKO9V_03215 [Candidatus Kapaibacterium sp.]
MTTVNGHAPYSYEVRHAVNAKRIVGGCTLYATFHATLSATLDATMDAPVSPDDIRITN